MLGKGGAFELDRQRAPETGSAARIVGGRRQWTPWVDGTLLVVMGKLPIWGVGTHACGHVLIRVFVHILEM